MADMWFGVRGAMRWVPCPAVGVEATRQGWQSGVLQHLNGSASVRSSAASHRTYNLSWNLATRARIRSVTDVAEGLSGQGLVYWADPFALDTNMVPLVWSAGMFAGYDGPILNGQSTRPTLANTPANTNGFPLQTVSYTVTAGVWVPEVWIPIPPGYSAQVGWTGTRTGTAAVTFAPTTGLSTGTAVNAVPLAVTSAVTTNNVITNNGSVDGVLVKLGGAGTMTLTAITVRLVPTAQASSHASVGFISGQGHGGCQFAQQPEISQYSAALDKVGLTAELVEVGGNN